MQKVGVDSPYSPWLAFIPIANLRPLMRTIKKSAWNILWILVPIADVIFLIIWQVRLFKAFRINLLWALLYIRTIIPVFNYLVGIGFLILYCFMGISKNSYDADFDSRNDDTNTFAS